MKNKPFTMKQAIIIRDLHHNNPEKSYKEIGDMFDKSDECIRQICTYETFKPKTIKPIIIPSSISEITRDDIIQDYRSGLSICEISKKYAISGYYICLICKAAPTMSAPDFVKMARDYMDGMSQKNLQKKYKITTSTFSISINNLLEIYNGNIDWDDADMIKKIEIYDPLMGGVHKIRLDKSKVDDTRINNIPKTILPLVSHVDFHKDPTRSSQYQSIFCEGVCDSELFWEQRQSSESLEFQLNPWQYNEDREDKKQQLLDRIFFLAKKLVSKKNYSIFYKTVIGKETQEEIAKSVDLDQTTVSCRLKMVIIKLQLACNNDIICTRLLAEMNELNNERWT